MPVILNKDDEQIWLNKNATDLNIIRKSLKTYPPNDMYYYKVSTIVNNSRIDTPDCIKPA